MQELQQCEMMLYIVQVVITKWLFRHFVLCDIIRLTIIALRLFPTVLRDTFMRMWVFWFSLYLIFLAEWKYKAGAI